MFKKLLVITILALGVTSCSKDYCGELATQVCKKAPDTKACQRAKTMTNKAACKSFLADMDKYIRLTNLKVTKPPLKPPATAEKKTQKVQKTQPVKPASDAVQNKAKDVPKSAQNPPAPTKTEAKKPSEEQAKPAKPAAEKK